ncbi:unnamed protein product [Phyllotreta striolata]|uniref:Uncharacterized protein n=1 Tax=Phyllotreta striolata TaxID=444603 RepID=A0A9N9TH32_PHYSR|nr:unnamed protein product [Phyllotreta striolata]
MKQQIYLLLSLTLHVGLSSCYGHGVKGSFSKSFSSSSASASSSAFSGSFSSGSDGDDLNNAVKSGSGAFSTAIANAGLNGAPAQAVSGSGSFAHSNSGSYSGSLSGHNADVGEGKTTAHFHNGGAGFNGQIPVVVSGSGSLSGANSGFLPPTVGGNPQGSKCAGNSVCNSGYNNQGTYSGQQGVNAVLGTQGQDVNINDVAKESGAFVNDFNIPDEFIPESQPKYHFPGPDGSIHSSKPAHGGAGVVTYEPQFPQIPTYSYVGASDGSYKPGECKSCKGPFPGPKGSIHDFKPVSHSEGNAPSWTPEQPQQPQRPQQPLPPLVRPTIDYSKLPGPSGSIYDSKPVTHAGNIPVAVIPSGTPYNQVPSVNKVPQVQPGYNQEKQWIKPGSIALKFIGKLPGPMGSIYTSFPVGKVGPNTQHVPVLTPTNTPTGKPGCTDGQCDEYGGRLSCHGVDCFGPGKKPDNVHFSNANSQANSNTKQEHENVNFNFGHPTLRPDEPDCLKGQCNTGPVKKPGNVHFSNANSQANSNNEHGNINYNFDHPSLRPEEPDCSRGQCNIDGAYHPEKSVPGLPGKTCSGLACLDHVNTQVNIPVPVTIVPQRVPDHNDEEHPKFDFDIDLRQKPEDKFDFPPSNNYNNKHTFSGNANSNTNAAHEGNINVHIGQKPDRTPNDIPVEAENPTTGKPVSGSRDFLLPGNKPYHHHHVVRPHHPNPENHPTPTHQPPQTPDSNYYKCTSESCNLPKPSEEPHTEELDVTIKCEGGNCERKYYSCTGSSCPLPHPLPNPLQPGKAPVKSGQLPLLFPNPFQPGKVPVQSGPERPVQPVIGVSVCTGESCKLPKPSGIPHQHVHVNPGCQGNQCKFGSDDRINNYPPYFEIPVPSQENRPLNSVGQFSGSNSAAKADGISYEEQINISDLPLDYSSDVSFNKNQGATKSKVGCTQGNCQLIPGSYSPGFVSGNVVIEKGNQQEIPVVLFPVTPCQGGKCSNQPCGNGKCGQGANGAQFGGHSEAVSGSFSGSTSHGGVNGCKNGACGLIPAGGGSYSGSSAFSGATSGSFANSNGPESGLKAIKDLITGLGQGVPGFNGASSFSHSGSSSYGSGFSGSYSSAGSSSY